MRIDFEADGAGQVALDCEPAYRETLVAPHDDMWSAFAEMASPYAIVIDDQAAGFCRINEEDELHRFFLHPDVEDRAGAILAELIERRKLVHALASTVDPGFLSLCLNAGPVLEETALMYSHVMPVRGESLTGLTVAGNDDHEETVQFARAAMGSPEAFLRPYLRERIERHEIRLHRSVDDSTLLATGEVRVYPHEPELAQLGLIVAEQCRGAGLGSRLMNALVKECEDRGLRPICSTEPGNRAAQSVIQRAGFRSRHRVLRIDLRAGRQRQTSAP